MQNPMLDTAQFWVPFNAKVNSDHREFAATLSKRASLLEILRYFWNHPWNSVNFVWYHPFMRLAKIDEKGGEYSGGDDGNLIGFFDSSIKHHGSVYVYEHEFTSATYHAWQLKNERSVLCQVEAEAETPQLLPSGAAVCAEAS